MREADNRHEIQMAVDALECASERFTNPKWNCVWQDAAEDCQKRADSLKKLLASPTGAHSPVNTAQPAGSVTTVFQVAYGYALGAQRSLDEGKLDVAKERLINALKILDARIRADETAALTQSVTTGPSAEREIEWLSIDVAPNGGESVYGRDADGRIRTTWFENGDWWYERITSELLTDGASKWTPVSYGRFVPSSSASLRTALEEIYKHTEEGELAPDETAVDLAQHVLYGRVVDESKLAPTLVKWNGGIATVARIAKAALAPGADS